MLVFTTEPGGGLVPAACNRWTWTTPNKVNVVYRTNHLRCWCSTHGSSYLLISINCYHSLFAAMHIATMYPFWTWGGDPQHRSLTKQFYVFCSLQCSMQSFDLAVFLAQQLCSQRKQKMSGHWIQLLLVWYWVWQIVACNGH